MSLYSVHHDRHKWENPEQFCPERFLDKDGKLISVEELYFFGFGKEFNVRRIFTGNTVHGHFFIFIGKRRCPGEALAQRFVTLVFANLMHDFVIEIDQLPNGVNSGILLTPKPYKIKMSKRE